MADRKRAGKSAEKRAGKSAGMGDRRAAWDPSAVVRLADFEALAAARLRPDVLGYYSGASTDERTLAANRAAFDRWRFVPRMGVDIADRDRSVEVLGRRWPVPFGVAPMALMRMADPEGEAPVGRACAARGILMTISTVGTATVEEVAATGTPRWFQLYPMADRAYNETLIARAEAAGCEAIVLTMDAAVLGRRERDVRLGFTLPAGVRYASVPSSSSSQTYGNATFKPQVTWEDLAWLARTTSLPVVAKGILHPDDARAAIDHGAAAVQVSNHGGRQLDGTIAALDALPAVAEAVAAASPSAPVLFDSGIRRGADVLAALALGARAVFLGRPVLWALAAGGEPAVGTALDLLTAEVDLALGLAGVTRADAVPRDLVVRD